MTANFCFGKAAHVRNKVDAFFAALPARTEEVKQRCRRTLQALADALIANATLATDEINHPFSPCD